MAQTKGIPKDSEESTQPAGDLQCRHLSSAWERAVFIIAVSYTLFILYTVGFHMFPSMIQRSIFLCFTLIICILLYPASRRGAKKGQVPFWDVILALFAVSVTVYTVINSDRIITDVARATTLDMVSSVTFVLLILEAARRTVGLIVPGLAITLILYALFGSYIPGIWGHPGISPVHLMEFMYMGTEGVFGIIVRVSSNIVAIFVVFGALLLYTGVGRSFIDIALLLGGRYTGGAAKVATIASSLFGMISGSASSNVVVTGSITIPTMKNLGYKPEFAAAVEATASSGGQIMVPIMGVAVFIMAELLGISYFAIVVAATIPAVLYYAGIFAGVHFYSARLGLLRMPSEMIPSARSVMRFSEISQVILPLAILMFFLVLGFTAGKAGFYATAATLIVYIGLHLSKRDRIESFSNIIKGMGHAGRILSTVTALVACAQILIAIIGLTGLGIKISGLIMSAAAGFVPLALVLAMGVCMVLGMGISSAAAYLVAAAAVAPALMFLGLEPLQAHLFLYYFAVFGAITPPVCIAVFLASGLAGAKWSKTAWIAIRLGIGAYIVPFMFVYSPPLLMVGSPFDIMVAFVTSIVAIVALVAGLMGFFVKNISLWERAILVVATLLMILPTLYTDVAGIMLFGAIWYRQTKLRKERKETKYA